MAMMDWWTAMPTRNNNKKGVLLARTGFLRFGAARSMGWISE
jgi:hypothetical protein